MEGEVCLMSICCEVDSKIPRESSIDQLNANIVDAPLNTLYVASCSELNVLRLTAVVGLGCYLRLRPLLPPGTG
jgi:hypothetical protein